MESAHCRSGEGAPEALEKRCPCTPNTGSSSQHPALGPRRLIYLPSLPSMLGTGSQPCVIHRSAIPTGNTSPAPTHSLTCPAPSPSTIPSGTHSSAPTLSISFTSCCNRMGYPQRTLPPPQSSLAGTFPTPLRALGQKRAGVPLLRIAPSQLPPQLHRLRRWGHQTTLSPPFPALGPYRHLGRSQDSVRVPCLPAALLRCDSW